MLGDPLQLPVGRTFLTKCLVVPGRLVWAAVLAAVVQAGCAPAFNWREVRPEGSGAALLMPCRPNGQERRVLLGGRPRLMTLFACTAAEQTWSLAFADVGDPTNLAEVLAGLVQSAGNNISATAQRSASLQVRGATPHAASQRVAFDGQLPDGKAVQLQVAVFVSGTKVFQATAVGAALPPEGLETFMGSLRIVH
jgi:hypothetical protein